MTRKRKTTAQQIADGTFPGVKETVHGEEHVRLMSAAMMKQTRERRAKRRGVKNVTAKDIIG